MTSSFVFTSKVRHRKFAVGSPCRWLVRTGLRSRALLDMLFFWNKIIISVTYGRPLGGGGTEISQHSDRLKCPFSLPQQSLGFQFWCVVCRSAVAERVPQCFYPFANCHYFVIKTNSGNSFFSGWLLEIDSSYECNSLFQRVRRGWPGSSESQSKITCRRVNTGTAKLQHPQRKQL